MTRPTTSDPAPDAQSSGLLVPCLLATAVGAVGGILLGRTVLAPRVPPGTAPLLPTPAPTHPPSAGLPDPKTGQMRAGKNADQAPGTLLMTITPAVPGTVLLLDGADVSDAAIVGESGGSFEVSLPVAAGAHWVAVNAPGYTAQPVYATVGPGGVVGVTFDLGLPTPTAAPRWLPPATAAPAPVATTGPGLPERPPAGMALLLVEIFMGDGGAVPPGTAVTANGAPVAGTNGTFRAFLRPGEYEVRAEVPGFDAYTTGRIVIAAGQTIPVEWWVRTPGEQVPRPTASPGSRPASPRPVRSMALPVTFKKVGYRAPADPRTDLAPGVEAAGLDAATCWAAFERLDLMQRDGVVRGVIHDMYGDKATAAFAPVAATFAALGQRASCGAPVSTADARRATAAFQAALRATGQETRFCDTITNAVAHDDLARLVARNRPTYAKGCSA